MPFQTNDIPVHHRALLRAALSHRFGRMACRRVINISKSYHQKNPRMTPSKRRMSLFLLLLSSVNHRRERAKTVAVPCGRPK